MAIQSAVHLDVHFGASGAPTWFGAVGAAGRALANAFAGLAACSAWAQGPAPTAPVAPPAPVQDLRSIVRQPAATTQPAAAPRHLTEQERGQLRRQLARDMRAQGAQPESLRP